ELCLSAGLPLDGLDEAEADATAGGAMFSYPGAPRLPPSLRPPPSPLSKAGGGPGVKNPDDNLLQSLRTRAPEQPKPPTPKQDTGADFDLFAELTGLIFRGAEVLRVTRGRGVDDLRVKVLDALQYCVVNVAPRLAFVEDLRAAVEKAEAAAR